MSLQNARVSIFRWKALKKTSHENRPDGSLKHRPPLFESGNWVYVMKSENGLTTSRKISLSEALKEKVFYNDLTHDKELGELSDLFIERGYPLIPG